MLDQFRWTANLADGDLAEIFGGFRIGETDFFRHEGDGPRRLNARAKRLAGIAIRGRSSGKSTARTGAACEAIVFDQPIERWTRRLLEAGAEDGIDN